MEGKPHQVTNKVEPVTESGYMVSVKRLVSHTAGLVTEMIWRLTIRMYKYTTVFINQISYICYVYMQKNSLVEEIYIIFQKGTPSMHRGKRGNNTGT